MRKEPFVTGQIYHIYNRGVDKRSIFSDTFDLARFIKTVEEFNEVDAQGGMFKIGLKKNSLRSRSSQLVTFVAFCIIDNHFHFLLKQNVDGGIAKFMQRFGGGYTKYFNAKHKRSGSLFQGKFKSKLVDSNDYLLRVFTYINYNDKIDDLRTSTSQFAKSSLGYVLSGERSVIECDPGVVTEQFNTIEILEDFMKEALLDIRNNKNLKKELEV